MNRPYYVVARDMQCFQAWCRLYGIASFAKSGPNRAVYVRNPYQLQGLGDGTVIVQVCDWWENYWTRPGQLNAMEQAIAILQATRDIFVVSDDCSKIPFGEDEDVDGSIVDSTSEVADPDKHPVFDKTFTFYVGKDDPDLLKRYLMFRGLKEHQAEGATDLLLKKMIALSQIEAMFTNEEKGGLTIHHEVHPKKASSLSYNDPRHPLTGPLVKAIPALMTARAKCPAWNADDFREHPNQRLVIDLVVHLNDHHKWSREAIADWLDTLDFDLSFQTPTAEEAS